MNFPFFFEGNESDFQHKDYVEEFFLCSRGHCHALCKPAWFLTYDVSGYARSYWMLTNCFCIILPGHESIPNREACIVPGYIRQGLAFL
jgi:hypothetical protein